jgi:Fur family peroxide stress response transcriptional regulator
MKSGPALVDPLERFNSIVQKIKENDQRLTPQRLAIVKILAHSEGHPSVEKIYQQLCDDFPTMSLATVYKTVSLVKDLGELLELGFSDGSNRYDGNKPYPHPHAICVRCQKIIDPDLASLEEIKEEVTVKTGFEIMTHRLDFFGICRECLNKA